MRIGMMVDMYKPHISGITNYVSLNKRVLEALGHKVFVFTFGDQDYEDDELNVVRSKGLPLNINETGFNMSFRYNKVAQRKVRSMDLEIVMRELGVDAPIKVIPNGVEIEPFRNPAKRLSRAEVGLPDEAVVLMYLGRLSPEKGLTTLLQAFLGVAGAVPGVVLALVGDGPDAEALRQQAAEAGLSDRVKFLGKAKYEDVPAYYKLADAFVTASETEVHPLSLIEAMAAGLPAVGIASPGVGDTVVDGVNGLLSAPDVAAFTAKLMLLVMQRDLRLKLAAQAAEDAEQYDIQRTAAVVLQQYEQLVARSARPMRRWSGLAQRVRHILP
jgi:1,2-diacylglycerol 3-alpha-glucosyltransferase